MNDIHQRVLQPKTMLEINTEIERQERLKALGKFDKTCRDLSNVDALAVVTEELSEIAEAIDAGEHEHARKEAIEVIACLVQWVQRDKPDYYYDDEIAGANMVLYELCSLGRRTRKILDAHNAKTQLDRQKKAS